MLARPTWDAEETDHCETPRAAFEDAAPFLRALARSLGKLDSELVIWDPFFCEGAAAKHFQALGFTSIHHAREDFYDLIKRGREPVHDVLLTNPPFSGTHMQKLLEYCSREGASPYMLLLPAFVANKRWYHELQASRKQDGPLACVFVGPRFAPYSFSAPSWARSDAPVAADAAATTSASSCSDSAAHSLLESTYRIQGPRSDDELLVDAPPALTVWASTFQCVWFANFRQAHEPFVLQHTRGPPWQPPQIATAASTEATDPPAQSAAAGSRRSGGRRVAEAADSSLADDISPTPSSGIPNIVYTVVGGVTAVMSVNVTSLPQFTMKRITPAERRWRKKKQKRGVSTASGDDDRRSSGAKKQRARS